MIIAIKIFFLHQSSSPTSFQTGMELFSIVPRTVEEIERVMAEGRASHQPLPQDKLKK